MVDEGAIKCDVGSCEGVLAQQSRRQRPLVRSRHDLVAHRTRATHRGPSSVAVLTGVCGAAAALGVGDTAAATTVNDIVLWSARWTRSIELGPRCGPRSTRSIEYLRRFAGSASNLTSLDVENKLVFF